MNIVLRDLHMCAVSETSDTCACAGDGGGGLVRAVGTGSIYLLISKQVFLQIKFVMNIPTSARLTKERPMHRPNSPPILETKDSKEISCNFNNTNL